MFILFGLGSVNLVPHQSDRRQCNCDGHEWGLGVGEIEEEEEEEVEEVEAHAPFRVGF